MDKELTVQEAALAWAQGKKVEARFADGGDWRLVIPVGGGKGTYNAHAFSEACSDFLFRLAPEPPAKRYRPWTSKEVPVGALLRACSWPSGNTAMITSVWDEKLSWVAGYSGHMECPLGMACGLEWNYSTDNGETWLPCGVQMEVES